VSERGSLRSWQGSRPTSARCNEPALHEGLRRLGGTIFRNLAANSSRVSSTPRFRAASINRSNCAGSVLPGRFFRFATTFAIRTTQLRTVMYRRGNRKDGKGRPKAASVRWRNMPNPNSVPLVHCSNCQALYQAVKAQAGPETVDLEIACQVCKGPLPARQGQFVLKYFLLREASRRDVQRARRKKASVSNMKKPRP
jgi:hypothetical protein